MTLLLQISDPHFGTEKEHVVEALVELTHRERPDVLILSGDITQRATREQFDAARRFVDRLKVPAMLAIPGNHDLPLFNLGKRLVAPYAEYRRAFGGELEPVYESDELLVIALNTTRPWRHKDGEVSREQVDRVARRLEQATRAQLRIVVTHQPIAVTREEDEPDVLHGNQRALRRWAMSGVDLILGGHIHLPFIVRLHERALTDGSPAYVVQAGTAVSSRLRHNTCNSVNLVRHSPSESPRRCEVERWDYSGDRGRFERVVIEDLRF
ncbi:metallophosphoesterase family protein [Piscinibacter koreensis]|uniref:Metallophosphoesterase n=1 Tax=Piscinibacter koreensis TaxID=2742824 RepID=A0A7Y6NQ21_9BURK|nr:metallophosphoesterase [Schlegelella koreensis]NUZ07255.1 metallophosphoesterase [Schlegelella koreensis]